ncbi:hypothetical protein Scep_024523 [Stephania cephalantha]|uniref:RNase H type-1 domain-containing protein n=1 Tax=Stephania cephalantha TaxID=152367 RepID=A0AAP0F3X9_9MAGN
MNDIVFWEGGEPPLTMVQRTTEQIRVYNEATCLSGKDRVIETPPTPLEGTLIFADTARDLSTGDKGIGWILVTHTDIVLKAGSVAFGPTSSTKKTEAWAIFEALQGCLDCIDLKMVPSDAKLLINSINEPFTLCVEIDPIVFYIRCLAGGQDPINFRYISRDLNVKAHSLP